MPPNKYHALVFISILVMLLLLGLHLLGIGYGTGQVSADGKSSASALARNSSQANSSSNNSLGAASSTALSQSYKHPIVYDKMTGATNNQINEILGSKPTLSEYPLDHYQHQLQLQKQQQQSQRHPLSSDDFFTNHMHHRQAVNPFGMQPVGPHLPPMTPPPPPAPPHMSHQSIGSPITSSHQQQQQRDQQQVSQQQQQRPRPLQQSSVELANGAPNGASDSIPSASSVTNNGSARPIANETQPQSQQQQQLQLQQQLQYRPSAYYTPPIFAYNNNIEPIQYGGQVPGQGDATIGYHNSPQISSTGFQQQPPLTVPEVPMSVDEYNLRLARLRQISQPQHLAPPQSNEKLPISQDNLQASRYGKQRGGNNEQLNLLADPQQQQLHKQQMLADRPQMTPFGQQHYGMPMTTMQPTLGQHQLEPTPLGQMNQTSYYPYQNLHNKLPIAVSNGNGSIRPPYAHQMSPNSIDTGAATSGNNNNNLVVEGQFGLKQTKAQNRIMSTPGPQEPQRSISATTPQSSQVGSFLQAQQVPTCARKSSGQLLLLAANSEHSPDQSIANNNGSTGAAMFCQEDSEYPTRDIMRALETYASERSIEQLLPQSLVQLIVQKPPQGGATQIGLVELQRQLALDPLQANVNVVQPVTNNNLDNNNGGQQVATSVGNMFPTANYEPMCLSNVYLAQPRRARNLLGQWKIIVNLPGHKYRGIAVSQMLRVEECSRPNSECGNGNGSSGSTTVQQQQQNQKQSSPPILTNRSTRCLQHYDYQRLVAWSHQQGLHVDMFRVPIACSCHIRR